MDYQKAFKLWLPAIFWCVVIFVLSSLPGADFAEGKSTDFTVRKILHVAEYAILYLTFYRGSKNIFVSFFLSLLYSVSDEVHQSFTPTRTGKVSDIFIDGLSSGVTALILWKYFQNLPQKLKTWLSE